MKTSIQILAAGLLLAAPAVSQAADEQPAASTRFAIPLTVSPQAKAQLEVLYAKLKALPPIAEPKSLAEFDKLNAMIAASNAASNEQTVKSLGVKVVDARMGGVPVLRVTPAQPRPGLAPIMYIHGGGYVLNSATSTVGGAAWIATVTGREVVSVDYTLAPRADYKIVTDQTAAVWKALLAAGYAASSMAIAGDSAGGNLTISTTLKLRDQRVALPGALWAMSPNTDLRFTGDSYITLKTDDPILSADTLPWLAAAYVGKGDINSPYASPVKGDFSKAFPPTLIQGGTHEILLSDFVRLYQGIRGGDHEAVLDLYEGMPHVFQIGAGEFPETKIAGDRAAAFLDAHLAKATPASTPDTPIYQ